MSRKGNYRKANFSKIDSARLNNIENNINDYWQASEKLGVVLDELVGMLDSEESAPDLYIVQYVAEARQTLRTLINDLTY